MLGTRFGLGAAGRAQPLFGTSLFGAHVRGASDFSRANSEMPLPASELRKFHVEPNPIEREFASPVLEPTKPWLDRATEEARKYFRDHVDDEERCAIKKLEAKRRYEALEQEQRENYFHDFNNWILGLGKAEDYKRSGLEEGQWGHGKLLSRHPEVIDYFDRKIDRKARYEAYIAKMRARGPGVGRAGGSPDMHDLWLFWKYIVRQLPMRESDFWFLETGTPGDEVMKQFTLDEGDQVKLPEADGTMYAKAGMQTKRMKSAAPGGAGTGSGNQPMPVAVANSSVQAAQQAAQASGGGSQQLPVVTAPKGGGGAGGAGAGPQQPLPPPHPKPGAPSSMRKLATAIFNAGRAAGQAIVGDGSPSPPDSPRSQQPPPPPAPAAAKTKAAATTTTKPPPAPKPAAKMQSTTNQPPPPAPKPAAAAAAVKPASTAPAPRARPSLDSGAWFRDIATDRFFYNENASSAAQDGRYDSAKVFATAAEDAVLRDRLKRTGTLAVDKSSSSSPPSTTLAVKSEERPKMTANAVNAHDYLVQHGYSEEEITDQYYAWLRANNNPKDDEETFERWLVMIARHRRDASERGKQPKNGHEGEPRAPVTSASASSLLQPAMNFVRNTGMSAMRVAHDAAHAAADKVGQLQLDRAQGDAYTAQQLAERRERGARYAAERQAQADAAAARADEEEAQPSRRAREAANFVRNVGASVADKLGQLQLDHEQAAAMKAQQLEQVAARVKEREEAAAAQERQLAQAADALRSAGNSVLRVLSSLPLRGAIDGAGHAMRAIGGRVGSALQSVADRAARMEQYAAEHAQIPAPVWQPQVPASTPILSMGTPVIEEAPMHAEAPSPRGPRIRHSNYSYQNSVREDGSFDYSAIGVPPRNGQTPTPQRPESPAEDATIAAQVAERLKRVNPEREARGRPSLKQRLAQNVVNAASPSMEAAQERSEAKHRQRLRRRARAARAAEEARLRDLRLPDEQMARLRGIAAEPDPIEVIPPAQAAEMQRALENYDVEDDERAVEVPQEEEDEEMPDEHEPTRAELEARERRMVTHRNQGFREMRTMLRDTFGITDATAREVLQIAMYIFHASEGKMPLNEAFAHAVRKIVAPDNNGRRGKRR